MPVLYKKYQLNKKDSKFDKKWYARAYMLETLDTEALARHMYSHNSPFTYGTILGVLRDMTKCIRELVLQSRQVKLNDLAIFKASLVQKGPADSAKEYTAATNIKGLKLTCRPTGDLQRAALTRAAVDGGTMAREYSIYDNPNGVPEANP